jgi:phosphoribosylformylglycinamidine cyclo-ligase
MEKIEIRGMAHITGGGFYENIPRMFKKVEGSPVLDAVITEGSWIIPPIFGRIAAACHGVDCSGAEAQKLGGELITTNALLKKQMFNTFNMGIGFVMALAPADVREAIVHLDSMGFPSYEIGHVTQAADANAAEGKLRFA